MVLFIIYSISKSTYFASKLFQCRLIAYSGVCWCTKLESMIDHSWGPSLNHFSRQSVHSPMNQICVHSSGESSVTVFKLSDAWVGPKHHHEITDRCRKVSVNSSEVELASWAWITQGVVSTKLRWRINYNPRWQGGLGISQFEHRS